MGASATHVGLHLEMGLGSKLKRRKTMIGGRRGERERDVRKRRV